MGLQSTVAERAAGKWADTDASSLGAPCLVGCNSTGASHWNGVWLDRQATRRRSPGQTVLNGIQITTVQEGFYRERRVFGICMCWKEDGQVCSWVGCKRQKGSMVTYSALV